LQYHFIRDRQDVHFLIFVMSATKLTWFVFLFLFFFCENLSSQTKNSNIAEYYSAINRAELLIVDDRYADAKKLYDSVSVDKLNFKDLFNYYLVALELNDTNTAVTTCEAMASRGVKSQFFSSSVFKPFKDLHSFNTIKEIADKTFAKLKDKNAPLIKVLDSLYKLDQEVFNYRSEHKFFDFFPDSLSQINDNNVKKQLSVINEYGFPSERKLGPYLVQDTILVGRPEYMMIPVHCLQLSPDYNLRERCINMYLSAYKAGNLDQASFRMLQSLAPIDMTGSLGNKVYCIYDRRIYKASMFDTAELGRINAFREKYFYPSLTDLEKKLKFKVTPVGRKFQFQLDITYYSTDDLSRQAFNQLREKYQLVN